MLDGFLKWYLLLFDDCVFLWLVLDYPLKSSQCFVVTIDM